MTCMRCDVRVGGRRGANNSRGAVNVDKEFELVVGEGGAGTSGVGVHRRAWTEPKARSEEGKEGTWNRQGGNRVKCR